MRAPQGAGGNRRRSADDARVMRSEARSTCGTNAQHMRGVRACILRAGVLYCKRNHF